jgi:hypothetical protein
MTDPMTDPMTLLQQCYDRVCDDGRELQSEDRIPQDWPLDSLATEEVLLTAQSRAGVDLLGDPRLRDVQNLGELCDLLRSLAAAAAS